MALSLPALNDQLRLFELSNLATSMRVPTIVANDVLFHEPRRRILQDVVTCIRHNVTIDELGIGASGMPTAISSHPRRCSGLFACYPDGLARTIEIVDRCRFSLDEFSDPIFPERRPLAPPAGPGRSDLEK